MAPFRGTFDHTLDAKNRLTVPARYRADFEAGVVLAKPLDQKPCVCVWQRERYDAYTEDAISKLDPLSANRTELQRFFFGNSRDTELDKAGRVMLPGFLGEHASLTKEVIIVGAGACLELWSKDAWSEHQPALNETVSEMTRRVDNAA